MKARNLWIIVLAAIGIILAFYGYRNYKTRQADLAKQAYIAQMRADFEKYVPEKLPEYCAGLPYPGEVTADAESSWEDTVFESPSGSTRWYKWQDTMTVTLHVDASFDKLSEREIYNMLERFSGCVWNAYEKVKREYFPDYNKDEYTHIWEIKCYDLPVNRMAIDDIILIKTPRNTYEHARLLKDYYILNDRDHFIRDEKSKWVTPEPTIRPTYTPKLGTSSSKTSPTDPYEAHLYSDPDEYAADYAEEFADEIGEDEDEGYDEAYDHWVYWHELYD